MKLDTLGNVYNISNSTAAKANIDYEQSLLLGKVRRASHKITEIKLMFQSSAWRASRSIFTELVASRLKQIWDTRFPFFFFWEKPNNDLLKR